MMPRGYISRRAALAGLGCAALAGASACAGPSAVSPGGSQAGVDRDPVEALMDSMTLEQKVAQLFIVTPEQLTGVDVAVIAGDETRASLSRRPVGGLCYFSQNITGADQLRDMLSGTDGLARASGVGIAPFLAVDEEGGPLVARVANSGLFEVERLEAMADIGAGGSPEDAAHAGSVIGGYLRDIGFNLDFAPVADVLVDADNGVIGSRSFGDDPKLVASMVAAEVAAMIDTGTIPCVKHFPGHGGAVGDSHTGAALLERTREELAACELVPFKAAIDAGCPMVMVGHIEAPAITGDDLPASVSSVVMDDLLRDGLGFSGVIVSDSFAMAAIADRYPVSEAAVRFFRAGGDVLLMPADFNRAFEGVLDALGRGALTEARIDASVSRVLSVKRRFGLIA